MAKCNITVHENQKVHQITCEAGSNLYAVLNGAGCGVDAPCGGRGLCGKCLLQADGDLSSISPQEKKFLSPSQIAEGFRLACITMVEGDVSVRLPKKRGAEVELSTNQGSITADRGGRFGAAVDIGTTTVAMYLYDLQNGKQLGSMGEMNRQRAYGADVISRISMVREQADGLQILQSAILGQLNELLTALSMQCDVTAEKIDRVTIASNTTMQHLAAGVDVSALGNAPYEPLTTEPLFFKGEKLGLTAVPDADIEFLGSISGYVGADIVAAILSSGLYQSEQPMLLIDIGTNGEMALGNKDGILCCSTAAGPAFEGAKIRCGCAGIEGAIDEVRISPEGVKFSTIGDKPPIGICGSAIIDIMAQMLESGIVTLEGRMLPQDEVPAEWAGIMGETEGEYGLIISQQPPVFIIPKDVREVQLAKAAICAGIYTLCDAYGIPVKKLPKVAIAGGFGAHINQYQAARIGLLPSETVERTYFLGNASGAGAIRALLSKEAMAATGQIRKMCKYIELANSKAFQEYYMDCMLFE